MAFGLPAHTPPDYPSRRVPKKSVQRGSLPSPQLSDQVVYHQRSPQDSFFGTLRVFRVWFAALGDRRSPTIGKPARLLHPRGDRARRHRRVDRVTVPLHTGE